MKIGTSHFISLQRAVKYYAPYGYTRQDVENKIKLNEISIGRPTTKPDEHLLINYNEGRYYINVRV